MSLISMHILATKSMGSFEKHPREIRKVLEIIWNQLLACKLHTKTIHIFTHPPFPGRTSLRTLKKMQRGHMFLIKILTSEAQIMPRARWIRCFLRAEKIQKTPETLVFFIFFLHTCYICLTIFMANVLNLWRHLQILMRGWSHDWQGIDIAA